MENSGKPHMHEHSHAHSHEHSHGSLTENEIKRAIEYFIKVHQREPNDDERHQLKTHGHVHERMENAGQYRSRELFDPSKRNFKERAFTVGVGGPVGSGKTALMLALCEALHEKYSLGAVTNDIFTREDAEFLQTHKALDKERIRAIETGGCPHAAIREDISANLHACEELTREFNLDIVLVESGGDNLAANYSRELADYIVYIIDVAGGDKIPRKGGPGITQADLFLINKIDLAPMVGADLQVMKRDTEKMRQNGPYLFTQLKDRTGMRETAEYIVAAYNEAMKC